MKKLIIIPLLFIAISASSQAINNFFRVSDSWTDDFPEWTAEVQMEGIWHFVRNENSDVANYNSPLKYKIKAVNKISGKVHRYNVHDNWNGHLTFNEDGGVLEKKHVVHLQLNDPVFGSSQAVITEYWTFDSDGNFIGFYPKIHITKP